MTDAPVPINDRPVPLAYAETVERRSGALLWMAAVALMLLELPWVYLFGLFWDGLGIHELDSLLGVAALIGMSAPSLFAAALVTWAVVRSRPIRRRGGR